MAYWLLKTEPEEFSWDDQVKRGAKGEAWTGVRNFTARGHLKEMKKGDKFFFYHTGDQKQVVGIGEVMPRAFSRPDRRQRRAMGRGDHRSARAAAQAGDACRHQGGAETQGHDLVKYARLSVQPVRADEWKLVCKMGGVKA